MESEKDKFMRSFEEKLKERLDEKTLKKLQKGESFDDETSLDYEQFRLETLPKGISKFEKFCFLAEKLLKLAPDKKTAEKLKQTLYKAHISATPTGVVSLAILISLILGIIGLFILLFSSTTIGFGIVILGLGSYFAIMNLPSLLEKKLKSKASDQIIIAIFYLVAYMRFTSNLELAVNFAANYLSPPLSLDFKRLLWELNNSKYPNIKQAFDDYLEGWRDDNLEFLEAIYLIESSLYESEEARRISLLDKSLDIILQGNYEKMLHFAQELRGKVSSFNMIGVVLPILGLIILPLAASFGSPKGTLEFVFLLYDILLPIGVGYYGFLILMNRPTSVNSIKVPTNLSKDSRLQKYELKLSKNKSFFLPAKIPAIFIFSVLFLIGLLPLIFHNISPSQDSCTSNFEQNLNNKMAQIFSESNSPFATFQQYKLLDDTNPPYCYGPYGTYPALLSLFLPLSFAFGIGTYLKTRYKNLIHVRDKTKQLEKEFPSATFQLGNRINEGISAELAFGAVAETMRGTEAGNFFSQIDRNIKFNGMSVKSAIFDSEKGAINIYPSDLILSSMKILVNAIDRGPEITAKTLIDLSKYLTEIHLSNERLLDLLAESLGSMKGQANFLAPIISGVVISIVALVTMIMGFLSSATKKLAETDAGGASAAGFLGESVPTYLFQSVVGFYIVMLIIILIYMVSNLENGDDPVFTKYQIGEKLIKGLTKYTVVVTVGIVLFTFVGAKVLPALG